MRNQSGLLLVALLCLLCGCNVITVNRQLTLRSYARLEIRPQEQALRSGRMRYYAGGQGFPVLLIHGFGFTALENWEHQVASLVRPYRVLAPDLYWFGGSTPAPGQAMTTAAAQADALSELLDRLAICKAHVVGVSFGGYVALELARRHPQQIGKLVLIDAAGLELTPAERTQVSAVFGGAEDISEVLLPRDVAVLQRFLRAVFHRPRWIPTFALRQVLREFWRNEPARRQILRGLQGGGLLAPPALSRLGAETLVLWGRHDPLIPPSVGERLTRAIPGARLRYLEGSAHSPMLEEPAAFNQALLEFLNAPPRAEAR